MVFKVSYYTERLIFRKPECCEAPGCKTFLGLLRKNLLLIMMIVGVAIGIGFGVGMRAHCLDALDAAYLAFPGTILIQGLKMLGTVFIK